MKSNEKKMMSFEKAKEFARLLHLQDPNGFKQLVQKMGRVLRMNSTKKKKN